MNESATFPEPGTHLYYGRDGQPISREKAIELMEHPERLQVALHTVGEAQLSTVHLPIDRNFIDEGPPVIFESMIFGGQHDGFQMRYSTEEDAQKGHALLLEALRNKKDPPL